MHAAHEVVPEALLADGGLDPDRQAGRAPRVARRTSSSSSTSENAECAARADAVARRARRRGCARSPASPSPRQQPADARLGALGELDLDRADRRLARCARAGASRLNRPSRVAAAEVAGADLEDELAAVRWCGREAALAGVLQAAGAAAAPRLSASTAVPESAPKLMPRDVHDRARAEGVAPPVRRRRAPCRTGAGTPAAPPTARRPRRGHGERRVLDDEVARRPLHLVVGAEAERCCSRASTRRRSSGAGRGERPLLVVAR